MGDGESVGFSGAYVPTPEQLLAEALRTVVIAAATEKRIDLSIFSAMVMVEFGNGDSWGTQVILDDDSPEQEIG